MQSTILVCRLQPSKGRSADFVDHCLEVLRQSVLCNADFSLYTFAWKTPLDRKPQTISDGQKKCVRWDKLEAWVLDRAVDASVDMILPSEEP